EPPGRRLARAGRPGGGRVDNRPHLADDAPPGAGSDGCHVPDRGGHARPPTPADCGVRANSCTMRSQKAGRSSGDLLVVMLPSVTTSSSTTSAPAFRRSVRTLGQEVSRRPRATSASTKLQGPWQMEATGFPDSTKSRTKAI